MECNSCLIEFEIGVTFIGKEGVHLESDVWYIVAYDHEEAETLVTHYMIKHYLKNYRDVMVDHDYEFIAMCTVDQITWEPNGKGIALL